METSISVFSFFLSVAYLLSFKALTVTFVYYYLKEHRFYHQSQIKYQISFLFIGYKNNDCANLFEVLKMILMCSFLFFVALLRNQTMTQIGVSYIIYLVYFSAQIMIKPFESKMENTMAALNEGCFMIVLLLLLILGLKDLHENFDES